MISSLQWPFVQEIANRSMRPAHITICLTTKIQGTGHESLPQ